MRSTKGTKSKKGTKSAKGTRRTKEVVWMNGNEET